jgi:hypothetical protein
MSAGQTTSEAAIVVWWREDREGRQVELLEVVPGPATAPDEAWPRQLVHPPVEPGGWAVANLPRLGALPDEVTARLRPPIAFTDPGADSLSVVALDRAGDVVASRDGAASDGLYDHCLRETCRLITQRLEQRTVRANPWSSGLLLARLRTLDDQAVLELAPAIVRDGALMTGIPVISIESGVRASGEDTFSGVLIEPPDLQPSAGEVDVALDALPPATGVPAVSLVIPRPADNATEIVARLELLMPDLHYAALADRWPKVAPGTRRSYIVVRSRT